MDSPSKKRTAQLLLCSLLLESCYNPNLGTGKKALPAPAAPTYQQGQYEERAYDKPTSPRLTPADHHPIQPTYHPRQRQAVVRSQDQLRATTQPLPRPGREAPRQQNEPAPTTQPIQAMPATPVQSSSPAEKTPPDIAHQAFPAQGGQRVRFRHQEGQWQARVTERLGVFSRLMLLPVVCGFGDIEAALLALQAKPERYTQRRIHVLPQNAQHPAMVFIGELGLQGGMEGAGEPSGSSEPQDEPPMTRPVGASERELRPALLSTLEPTQSQGPTPLEQDQQEAAQLREEIAQRYSKLPQATEEADAQVLEELKTRLARLSKLDPFCAPAPGSDGAKEHIAKLRQTHHTHWGPTAYGAKARKELTALLELAYAEELKRVGPKEKESVNEPTNRVARLAKVLSQLAALHQEQGEETSDLTYYTDAATLYQNMLHVCAKGAAAVGAPGYQTQIAAAYSGLAQLRQALVAKAKGGEEGAAAPASMSAADLREEITSDQQALQALRDDAQEKVTQLEALLNKPGNPAEERAAEQAYIEGSRALFEEIAQGVKAFLDTLYQESEQELGPAPCQYTVMGLGSMALAQMTPYSDLEFAILMEDAPDAATAEHWRQYLRHLTHLVHFRVINLGETVIPMSKYKLSLDHLGKRGLNFDLGGKTPLGRRDKPHLKKPYELIQPVAGMIHYLRNEGDKSEHMDKLLPFILESTCYVHGDEELHAAYVAAKHAFLTQDPVYKARALKKLLEGVVEMDYRQPGITKSGRQQKGDLADFAPQFGSDDVGRLYDVKQEIYRFPDRLLYRLAMYHGLLPESGWDAVDQLANQGIIGQGASAQDAAHHLQYIVSFATMLRLRTYLHYGQQAEKVTMPLGDRQEAAQQAVSQFFTLPPAALRAGGSLFKYYYTALPLHRQMETFFSKDLDVASEEAGFFQAAAFYDASDQIRGDIYQRLLQPKAAILCHEQALAIAEQSYGPEHPEVATILNNLGNAWSQLEDPQQAIKCFKRVLAIVEQSYGPEHPHVATTLNNLGNAWNALGNPQQAISYFERALHIYEQSYGPEHPQVATSLNNLGLAWNALGDPQQAISYFERSLPIAEQSYGPEHPHVATTLNNLGNAWNALGNPQQAISYFERALPIWEQAYGLEHPHVAMSLNNLGGAWNALGNPQQAISYFERALPIVEQSYGPEHPQVAMSLNNLGGAWIKLGNPQQAISYFERALPIWEQSYGPEHPQVAMSLNNLGEAWRELGNPQQAISYFERALPIWEQSYGPEHPQVATSLNNLGGAWNALGNPQQAISYFERALPIWEQAYGLEHPHVATTLNNLGEAWRELGNPQQAISYFERALHIFEQSYGPEHPQVAMSLNNLGRAWQELGNPQQAISYFERALHIWEQAYGLEHPHVAASLNNLGEAWRELGNPQQAISYFERALHIVEQSYGLEHPHVATTLNNLGRAWQELGNPQQAISYFERALHIWEQAYGLEHPHVAASLNNLGEAWRELGNPQQAISYFERALHIFEQSYGPEHPQVATTLNNLGTAWHQLGDLQQALSYLERAFHIMKETYGEHHPSTQTVKRNLEQLAGRLANNTAHQTKQFIQACVAGNEDVANSLPIGSLEKDRYDAQGNALIAWMAQHEMTATLEKVLQLGWNPNLPNTCQIYPLHYGAMKNPGMVRLLLPYADPFVQTAKGSTPAMVAKSKGNMEALSLLLPSITGLSLQDPAAFDASYATCRDRFLATPTHSLEHLVQVFSLACHFKDWELAREVAARHNLRPIISQVTQQYPAAEKSLLTCIDAFTEACQAGNDPLALEIAGQFTFEKDLYDAQGNALIAWMAQHEMVATLEKVLNLGWNPNLPNTSQVYPLHYGAMKNPSLTQCLLQAGAHPFVQTPKGNTPAQVARSKGKVATLAVLLPPLAGISFEDMAAFEASYQAYKQHLATHQPAAAALLAALALALQLGDAALVQAIAAQQAPQPLLAQLIAQYPWAAEALQARLASLLQEPVDEPSPS